MINIGAWRMLLIGLTMAMAVPAGAQQAESWGTYLMAFHACTDCQDPRLHTTYLATSDDGISWRPAPGYTAAQGSVPDVIRRGDTIYIYNPGKLRRYDLRTGTWQQQVEVSISHHDGTTELFVDPSAILDEAGRIVLFYLVGSLSGDPASCAAGETSCVKTFRSATEVDGSDGALFQVDPGNRFQVTIGQRQSASDPDIFTDGDRYVMLISRGSGVQAVTSESLRGDYQLATGLSDGWLSEGAGSVPSGHYDTATMNYWLYLHSGGLNTPSAIKMATQPNMDRSIPQGSFTAIISGATYPGLDATHAVESPGFAMFSQ